MQFFYNCNTIISEYGSNLSKFIFDPLAAIEANNALYAKLYLGGALAPGKENIFSTKYLISTI